MIKIIDEKTISNHKGYMVTYDSWGEINGENIHVMNRGDKGSLLHLYLPNSGTHIPPMTINQVNGKLPVFTGRESNRYIQISSIDAMDDEDKFHLELSGYNMWVDV